MAEQIELTNDGDREAIRKALGPRREDEKEILRTLSRKVEHLSPGQMKYIGSLTAAKSLEKKGYITFEPIFWERFGQSLVLTNVAGRKYAEGLK